MANYLVSGAAGFIASRVTELLLEDGHRVLGVDNMNDAYDVRMKEYRLKRLVENPLFTFLQFDISDRQILTSLEQSGIEKFAGVINLAARAGVRQSVENEEPSEGEVERHPLGQLAFDVQALVDVVR